MATDQKFYVTTPIYYVTAKPHLGSLYSTVIADVIARWQQLQAKQTFFLTGTDEHGQKVQQAALQAGKAPQAFVDDFIPAYKHVWHEYEIAYSHFIRTTDQTHIMGAQQFVQTLIDNGAVYKDTYHGWYCTPCETFVTEKDQTTEKNPLCPSCGRATILVSEETYFFRLSAYQEQLLAFYKQNPHFIVPKARYNEVITFVESGLKDLSISRTTVAWGVPFAHDPSHTIYVWVEALCNYLTGIGYGQKNKEQEFKYWWPADVHVLGKDIIRFHGVYWPAFLLAARLPLPKQLLVHGWIQINQQKMSKSLGNVVDPMALHAAYGADPVRYYLMRTMAVTQDGEFSIADLEQHIESDLANDLGNLLQRMVSLAEKYEVTVVKSPVNWSSDVAKLQAELKSMVVEYTQYMDEYQFHMALARLWKYIHALNAYFHGQEPWKIVKQDKEKFVEIIAATCHGLYAVGILLWPVMPRKMEILLASLGIPFEAKKQMFENAALEIWQKQFMLTKIEPLFVKPIAQEKVAMQPQVVTAQPENTITIDDFAKVELRVGTILSCEPIEKSDKLYRLQVDFGDVKRQILSGVKKYFTPQDLINKQAVFVYNLAPRAMMGFESHGMLLTVDNGAGSLAILNPSMQVPNGTRLK